jgi:hypothetical protein
MCFTITKDKCACEKTLFANSLCEQKLCYKIKGPNFLFTRERPGRIDDMNDHKHLLSAAIDFTFNNLAFKTIGTGYLIYLELLTRSGQLSFHSTNRQRLVHHTTLTANTV